MPLGTIGSKRSHMSQTRFQSLLQINQQGASGSNAWLIVVETETVQRNNLKMRVQRGSRGLRIKRPIRAARYCSWQDGSHGLRHGCQHRLGNETFGAIQSIEFVGQSVGGHIGGLKLPRRDFHPCQPMNAATDSQCDQVVRPSGVKEFILGDSARRDDSRDFAFDQSFGERGVLNLIANRNAMPRMQQLSQIDFDGFGRNASHGNGAVAARQREAQNSRH